MSEGEGNPAAGPEPAEVAGPENGVVLAIYTHPDDCEISCGATLAKWAAADRTVIIAVVTDGEKGSQNPAEDRAALVATRQGEQRAGAARLGAGDVRFFDYRDGELENTPEVRADLVRLIREIRPGLIVCPDPTAWFFGGQYYNHRDHRMTGEAVLDAVSPAAGNPHFFREQLDEGLEPWNVPEMWLAPTLEPNHTEDVTGFVETKLAALEEHRSQLADDQLAFFRTWLPAAAEEEGKKIGVTAGEGFRVLSFG
jgi:LmbE family N-acetylglucosaminyl deacetylase